MDLFNEALRVEDYTKLVERLYGFYAPLDDAIDGIMPKTENAAGYSYAPRSALLAQDMLDLGFSSKSIRMAPRCERAFDLVSKTSLGGVLYVVEGATLGGARIDRAVRKLLQREDLYARNYWSWCRSVNQTRWPMTLTYLERLVAEGADANRLKDGAGDTFRLFATWLAPLDRLRPRAEQGPVKTWM